MRNTVYAVAAMIGAIIGAGVLGIPYVFAKAGVLLGLSSLILIGLVVLLMNLMLGEVTLRTKKSHMLPKLAEIFLGKTGKVLMFSALFAGIWGAMIAYLIGVGESLAAIFGISTILGLSSNLFFSLIFFATASTLVYFGLKAVTKGELLLAGATVLIIIVLSVMSFTKVNISNLATVNFSNIFLPYGVILFAVLGSAMVPEVRRILENDKKAIKKALLIGVLTPIILYGIFSVVVVGVTGASTTEIATIGLGFSLGAAAIFLGNLFAIFAMASSFVILGLALKDSLIDGLNMNAKLAFLLTIAVPLLVFLLGVKSFIGVIGVTGAVAGGLDGILIALMWRSARRGGRTPEYRVRFGLASYLLILVFSLGIIYTFLNLLGIL
jgi:amino acid permease